MKQTWYFFGENSKSSEFLNILHLPYTLMCIAFLTIGFAISGIKNWNIYFLSVVSYFFGLGISAHCFDQLKGMGSRYVKKLTDTDLFFIGLWFFIISINIGIYAIINYKLWHLLWLIPLQSFFVFSYPLAKLFGGKFHSDFWFSVSFGAIPVIIGNYANTSGFSLIVIMWSILTFIIAYIEIILSRHVRNMRKTYQKMYSNDPIMLDNVIYKQYIEKPELALKLLCAMSYLLALIVILKYNYRVMDT